MRSRLPPEALEGLLYLLLFFGPFAFGCVEPWSRAFLEILAYATALACFLRGREAATYLGDSFWIFPAGAAVFGCLQVLGAAAADAPRPAWPFTASVHATEAQILLWAAYAAVVYSVPRIVTSPPAARRFARAVFLVGLAVTALGALQAATSKDMIYWTRPTMRDVPPFGPYYNLDHAANLLMMSFALGAGILASRMARWNSVDGPLPDEVRAAALTGAGLAALIAAVLFCHSRGALLAMALAGGAFALIAAGFAKSDGLRRGLLAGALVGTALVGLCIFAYVRAGGDVGAPMDRSVSTRLTIYEDGIRWLRDTPVFGAGLGSFTTVYPAYQDQSLRAVVPHAHSDWLEFALETGAAGVAAAIAALGLFFYAAVRAWRRARSRETRALIGGAVAACLAFAAHSLFEFSFQIPANAVLFWALAGYLISAPGWADKNVRLHRSSPPDLASGMGAAACFLIIVWAALQPAAAAWSAGRAADPSVRFELLKDAAGRDDDPDFTRSLARETYRVAVEGPDANPVFLRAALIYALNAAAARPFDPGSLYLAGASLARLRRAADGEVFRSRERLVRFSPYAAARSAPQDWDRRRLEMLKQMDLLPLGAPRR